ncbi:MAG: hypothetical protein HY860_02850, partial [Chlamydiales bacterium]|nr:hypothetical protein [Chlamydiales bacterium]
MISIINKNSFLIFSSLIIMALGHPAIVPFFCLFASTIGLSFFWRALIDISSQKQKFFLGFGYFSIMQAVQLWWLVTTKYHGTGIVIVYLLLVILIGLQGGLFSLLFQNKKFSLRHMLLFPAVWTLMEWSRLYFFSGFAFNQLGLSWTFSLFPMQFAALGGV